VDAVGLIATTEDGRHVHGLRMASDLARRLGEQWQRVHGRSPTANEVPTEPS
jgi:hypothetical protein